MPEQDLDRILSRLRKESLDTAPIADTAGRIEMLAAEDLAKVKKTADAGRIVAMVKDWHTACESARLSYVQQWYKNLDMYQGRQFTEWSKAYSTMVESPAPSFEPRIAVNIIEPACRTEMAKTGTNHPTASVAPASNDDSDVMAALAGQQVWDWFYAESKFQSLVFSPANFWRTICGNGFIKTWVNHGAIDEAATESARREAEKQTQLDASQGLALPAAPVTPIRGKITADAVSPFHLFVPDLAEQDLQKQAYVLHAYAMNTERAKLTYRDFVPENWNPSQISANSVMDVAHLGIRGGNPSALDSVLVIEAWVKPGITALLPEGGLVILVADEIVGMADAGIPYDHGQYPFAHITAIESGGFYRKSVVESIIALQNELNRTYAQIIKSKNLTTKPQFFYPEGSVDPGRITSRAGQYIPIRLGMPNPQPVPITELPRYVLELIDRIKSHLDDITGQHQVSRAISPGADTAASALALLQETDDNFLSTTFDSITAGIETVARQYLSLTVQFWDEPRLVKVTGDSEAFDARSLKASDLKNGTDIRIDSESMLPKSKAGKIATITEWIDKGIIAPEVGLEAMEMGTLGKVYSRLKLDRESARRENVEMRGIDVAALTEHYTQAMAAQQEMAAQQSPFAGIVDPAVGLDGAAPMPAPAAPLDLFFPINWFDNDAIHVEEHKAYAKGQEYKNLPPEIQKELEQHTAAHEDRLAQQMMQQAMVGAPVGPDGAPAGPDGYAGANEPQPLAA